MKICYLSYVKLPDTLIGFACKSTIVLDSALCWMPIALSCHQFHVKRKLFYNKCKCNFYNKCKCKKILTMRMQKKLISTWGKLPAVQ